MPSLDFLEAEGDVAGVRAKLAELDTLRAENADLKKQLKRQKPDPVGVR